MWHARLLSSLKWKKILSPIDCFYARDVFKYRQPDWKRQDYSKTSFIREWPSQASLDDSGLHVYQLTASRFYTRRL